MDDSPAYHIQHIHDIRLVRAPQAAGDEDLVKLATDTGHNFLMGCRLLRILRTGTCKQDRIQRQRRPLLPYAAESNPGSHIAYRIHCDSDTYV